MAGTLRLTLYVDAVSELHLPKLARLLESKGFRVKTLPPVSLQASIVLGLGEAGEIVSRIRDIASSNYLRGVCFELSAKLSKCPCSRNIVKVRGWTICSDTYDNTQFYVKCGERGGLVMAVLTGSLRDLTSPPHSIFTACRSTGEAGALVGLVEKALNTLTSYVKSFINE